MSVQTAIISLNSTNLLTFVIVKCVVLLGKDWIRKRYLDLRYP
jgi:hypothetical protein